jgi:Zn-dependent protease
MNTNQILMMLSRVIGVIIAITVHQFFYALTSVLLGDNLPKKEGRLTLNPLKQIEPVGFIIMLISMFGWGKPVNINPAYYKDKKFGTLVVSFSGITANLCLAAIIGLILKFATFSVLVTSLLQNIALYNIVLAVLNFIPVYPLDGYRILLVCVKPNFYFKIIQSEKIIQMILMFLAFAGVLNWVLGPVITLLFNLFV